MEDKDYSANEPLIPLDLDDDFEDGGQSPLIPLDLDDEEDYSGNEIIHVGDDYTSRICPKCGREYGKEYKYPRCSKDGGELFMLWKCRHCGEDFSKVQGYAAINVCPNCGKTLDPKQKEAINTGRCSETNVLKRICTKCQEIFDEEFECCGICGNSTIPMQCACAKISVKKRTAVLTNTARSAASLTL